MECNPLLGSEAMRRGYFPVVLLRAHDGGAMNTVITFFVCAVDCAWAGVCCVVYVFFSCRWSSSAVDAGEASATSSQGQSDKSRPAPTSDQPVLYVAKGFKEQFGTLRTRSNKRATIIEVSGQLPPPSMGVIISREQRENDVFGVGKEPRE